MTTSRGSFSTPRQTTFNGSSRIGVKSAEFGEYPQLEVDEIPVTVCNAYCCPQSVVGALDESVGNSFDEIV